MIRRCVLGHEISYSLSPALHDALSAARGEKASYTVEDVSPRDLDEALPRLLAAYDGFNVTKPYKSRVAAYFGETQPINTVRCADRRVTSTDPVGFMSDYTRAFGTPIGKILLLGGGGAARSVASALCKAEGVRLYVYNRTASRAIDLAATYGGEAVSSPRGRYDAVVNATSAGLHGEDASEGVCFDGVRYAYDLVYTPPQTPFLRRAKEAGAKACGGMGMLVYQAIAAHEFWCGVRLDDDRKRALYEVGIAALARAIQA